MFSVVSTFRNQSLPLEIEPVDPPKEDLSTKKERAFKEILSDAQIVFNRDATYQELIKVFETHKDRLLDDYQTFSRKGLEECTTILLTSLLTARKLESWLKNAAEDGKSDLFKLLPTNFTSFDEIIPLAFLEAIKNNHFEIVECILKKWKIPIKERYQALNITLLLRIQNLLTNTFLTKSDKAFPNASIAFKSRKGNYDKPLTLVYEYLGEEFSKFNVEAVSIYATRMLLTDHRIVTCSFESLFTGLDHESAVSNWGCYLTSNEFNVQAVRNKLISLSRETQRGIYLGVSGLQNFGYIFHAKANYAILVDINPKMVSLNRWVIENIKKAANRHDFLKALKAKIEVDDQNDYQPNTSALEGRFKEPRDRLLLEVDLLKKSQTSSFFSDQAFKYLKEMAHAGLIVTLCGDITEPVFMENLARRAHSIGRFSLFYVSNVFQFTSTTKVSQQKFITALKHITYDNPLIVDAYRVLVQKGRSSFQSGLLASLFFAQDPITGKPYNPEELALASTYSKGLKVLYPSAELALPSDENTLKLEPSQYPLE